MISRILNLNDCEWPKVSVAWLIRLFYRVGFVVGWTTIVAMFTSKYGIKMLPLLFILNAFFSVLGSLFYSTFLDRFPKRQVMIVTVLIAILVLLIATLCYPFNGVLFFLLLVAAEAVFLVQFRILLDGYIEEMFNPLESERTFSVIEAAETIGGMIAGLIVVTFSNSFSVVNFVYFWIFALILIIPCILLSESINKEVRLLDKVKSGKTKQSNAFSLVFKSFAKSRHSRFIRGLSLIIFAQWFLSSLIEYQFTRAVYANVSHVVMDGGGGFEHAFIHDLGVLFIVFSVSAMLVQIFVGSRLVNSLGVVGSMILHPIVSFLSFIGLTFSFNYYVAIFVKNNFTITSAIFTNAYHSTYYAVKEKLRDFLREFLEGIVRPLGALSGTLLLLFLTTTFTTAKITIILNSLMVVISAILFILIYWIRGHYTLAALDDLKSSRSTKERINSVGILAQKGHKSSSFDALVGVLHSKKEPLSLRLSIIHSFTEFKSYDSVRVLVQCLKGETQVVYRSVLNTLLSYGFLKHDSHEDSFVRCELLKSLKSLYKCDIHDDVRHKVIILMSKLSHETTVEFLLTMIKKSKSSLRADSIRLLSTVGDSSVGEYIRPYLKSKNLNERISAVIALAHFKEFEEEALYHLSSFLYSRDSKKIIWGIFAVGEIGLMDKIDHCLRNLNAKNIQLKMYSALSLAKLGHSDAVPVLVDLLFDENKEISRKIRKLLKNVDVRISKNIDRIVRDIVSREIATIVCDCGDDGLSRLGADKLLTLRWLYRLIEQYDEMEFIDNILSNSK